VDNFPLARNFAVAGSDAKVGTAGGVVGFGGGGDVVETVDEGQGWREERTGLHEREFIETRRHWFTEKVVHHTDGSVQVLNLVEGREVVVESPSGAFEPFIVHYAETFVVPEHVKEYSITPYGESAGRQCATMKAFVRKNP